MKHIKHVDLDINTLPVMHAWVDRYWSEVHRVVSVLNYWQSEVRNETINGRNQANSAAKRS